MAQYKRPTIADRNNEYRAKRMAMMISPARQDPFAGGGCFLVSVTSRYFFELSNLESQHLQCSYLHLMPFEICLLILDSDSGI